MSPSTAIVAGGDAGPGRGRERIGMFLVAVQVVLVAAALFVTGIETAALRRITALAAVGFVLHHYLPRAWRMRFFAAFSGLCLVVVMGGVPNRRLPDLSLGISRAAVIVAVGAGLIAICHLSLGFWRRAGLLALAGAGLAGFRAGAIDSGALAIVWPVVGGLFMFRLIVYLYDESTTPSRPSASRSLGYFFLPSNACALLFPVVDYRTFTRRYYDEPALTIYQRGATWMARGVVQLLLHHFVNLTVALGATDVHDGTDLIRYVLTNVFQYVKISGEFHLLIGLLLLFGFNLPETNRRYFLAASFTDYWRRVNTYWREFMMKVCYYPAFFRLRRLGPTRAMVLAVAWTFLVTWALHLYQTWWVTGAWSLTWTDSLFWTLLALLVLGGSLWEFRRGRRRQLAAARLTGAEAAGIALRTAATFAVITFLWSLWSAPGVAQWLHLWSLADRWTLAWGGVALAVIMLATVGFELLPRLRVAAPAPTRGDPAVSRAFWWNAAGGIVTLLLVVAGSARLLRLPDRPGQPAVIADARAVLRILRQQNPSGDARGYYEKLTTARPGNREFWETIQLRETPFHYAGDNPLRPLNDLPFYEPVPNVRRHAYDTDYATNRWGMRARDYPLHASPGTWRLALLGSSHVMGWGVPVDATFASLIERQLNATRGGGRRVEVLNFAVPGYGPLGQLALLERRVRGFAPNVVIHVAHGVDGDWVNRDVAKCLRAGLPWLDPGLADLVAGARVTGSTHPLLAAERLRAREPEMLRSVYARMVATCRDMGAVPVCVVMPLPGEREADAARGRVARAAAEAAGFVMLDLSRVFAGRRPETLQVPEPGRHSNATAHALIARELYRQIVDRGHPSLLPAGAALTEVAE